MDISITTEQFLEALSAEFVLSDNNRELLIAVYGLPNHCVTHVELAHVRQYADSKSAELQFGLVGRRIAEKLSVEPEGEAWWQVIATGAIEDRGFVWTLRKELIDAMVVVGWIE